MPAQKHVIKIADSSGDAKIEYNPEVATEVETASQAFERYANEGRQIFRFPVAGQEGEANGKRPFDASVEKYLIMPRAAGG